MELAYAEGGAEECAGKGSATCNGFVLVEGGAEGFATEGGLDACTDGRDTGRAANELDSVDLVDGETRLGEGLLERKGDAIQDGGDEFFIGVTGELGRSINVVHDGFDAERCLHVGRENFLEAFTADAETECRFWAGEDVDLVFGLELVGKVSAEGIVDVTTTEMSVVGGGFDDELAF